MKPNDNRFKPEPFNCKPACYEPTPDFPQCCPPPPPKPMPCVPLAPSVVEGNSLYEAVNNLTNRVNVCINTYNDVMANCYKTLHNLEAAAEENGAYYGPCEVWTEKGYYPEQSAGYNITHKAVVDRRGEPIRIQLGLAYNNTTNSGVSEKISTASKQWYADKIITAQTVGNREVLGWAGNAIYKGMPIPSRSYPEGYTMGFTRSGVMRVYQNNVSTDQMLCDTIENATGVETVLIQNGVLESDDVINESADATTQLSRIAIGQNITTREVIILTCGQENNVNLKGLTAKACAQILLQYGCDIAVLVASGVGAGAMDKGSQMFIPKIDTDTGSTVDGIPDAYSFWYISRKCYYKSDYERELAELMQNYGECIWQTYLNGENINGIADGLTEETANRIQADKTLQENIDSETAAREAADTVLQNNIDAEVERAKAAEQALDEKIEANSTEHLQSQIDEIKEDVTELTTNLNQEITDRTNSDAELRQSILTEQGARIAADTTLQTNINNEVTARTQAVSDLDSKLQSNIDVLGTKVTAVEGNITTLQGLYDTLQKQTAAMDTAITAIQTTISSIEEGLNNVKTSIEQLRSEINTVETSVNNIINGNTELPYLKLTGGTTTGPISVTTNNYTLRMGASTITSELNGANAPLTLETSDLSLNSTGTTKIHNVANPTAATDAANKQYVDSVAGGGGEGGPYLPLTGGTLSGNLTVNSPASSRNLTLSTDNTSSIISSTDTSGSRQLISLQCSELSLEGSSGSTVNIKNLSAPVNNNDAVNKSYADTKYFPKSGGTINGAVQIMEPDYIGNLIVNTSDVNVKTIASDDAGNQIDLDVFAKSINLSGGPKSGGGELSVKVSNLSAPTDNLDAANKMYVDTSISNIDTSKFYLKTGGRVNGEVVADNIVVQPTISENGFAIMTGNNDARLIASNTNATTPLIIHSSRIDLNSALDSASVSRVVITNLGDPTTQYDAAHKRYVDTAAHIVNRVQGNSQGSNQFDFSVTSGIISGQFFITINAGGDGSDSILNAELSSAINEIIKAVYADPVNALLSLVCIGNYEYSTSNKTFIKPFKLQLSKAYNNNLINYTIIGQTDDTYAGEVLCHFVGVPNIAKPI